MISVVNDTRSIRLRHDIDFRGGRLRHDCRLVVDKKDDFAKLANAWIGTKNLVAQSEIKKVLDGTMTYGTMTTKVANAYSISETSGLSSLSMTTSGAKIISAGSVEISGHTELNLKCYAKGTFNAAILKFG